MVRFAEDAVLWFKREDDARRVMAVLGRRLERFVLQLNDEKIKLMHFGPLDRETQDVQRRFGRALKRVVQWCRLNRHRPVSEQQAALNLKLRGHYAYFGITGNSAALSRFRREVERAWRKWLNRRSHHAGMNWDRFPRILARYPLAPPRVVHSVYAR